VICAASATSLLLVGVGSKTVKHRTTTVKNTTSLVFIPLITNNTYLLRDTLSLRLRVLVRCRDLNMGGAWRGFIGYCVKIK